MKRHIVQSLAAGGIAASLGILSLAAVAGGGKGNIPFPEDFRGWTHTKSTAETDRENPFFGYRNVYVNDIGIEAMRSGTAYPDGSLIVMSFHEPVAQDSAIVQGKPMKYVLMLKDSDARETDGWRYEAYPADTMTPIVGADAAEKCHGCHTSRREQDFVFSGYVE